MTPKSADDLFIVVAAFRYALGRRSYAPGLVARWIEARKQHLPQEARAQIAQEIRNEADAVSRRDNPLPYAERWLALAASLEQTP